MQEQNQNIQHEIVGTWEGSDHPFQKTILVFFENGQGLLFYFIGGEGGSLNEFTWVPLTDDTLELEWQVLYDAEYDGTPSSIKSGVKEEVTYAVVDDQLKIDFEEQYIDGALDYLRSADEYNAAHQYLSDLAENYNPFDYCWVIDGDSWYSVQANIVEEDKESHYVDEGLLHVKYLPLIFGVFGQIAYLGDYGKDLMPGYLRIILHCVPLLLLMFRSDSEFESDIGRAVIHQIRSLASIWFLAITLAITIAAVYGYRPRGWELSMAFTAAGTVFCINVFRRRRIR